MYPRNAASPPRIAIGAVIQISDGAVQSTGVSVVVRPEGGSETAGAGTVSYGASSSVVYYAPTQTETNYTAFVVTAYKTGCIPVSQTVITSASATSGRVVLSGETHTGAVIPTVSALTGHTPQSADHASNISAIKTKTDFLPSATAGAAGGVFIAGSNAATSVTTALTANITGNLSGSVGSVTGAVGSVTGAVGSVTAGVTLASGTHTGAVIPTVTDVTNLHASAATAAELAKVPKSDGTATWNATALASINAECDTAISDAGLTAAGIADAVWDEATSGHTTAGTTAKALTDVLADTAEIGAAGAGLTAVPWNAAWDAEVQSECTDALNAYDPPTKAETDALLTTAMTESYATDGSTMTPAQALYMIWAALSEFAISGTTITAKKLDGSTTAMTWTLDSDTAPTSRTRAT